MSSRVASSPMMISPSPSNPLRTSDGSVQSRERTASGGQSMLKGIFSSSPPRKRRSSSINLQIEKVRLQDDEEPELMPMQKIWKSDELTLMFFENGFLNYDVPLQHGFQDLGPMSSCKNNHFQNEASSASCISAHYPILVLDCSSKIITSWEDMIVRMCNGIYDDSIKLTILTLFISNVQGGSPSLVTEMDKLRWSYNSVGSEDAAKDSALTHVKLGDQSHSGRRARCLLFKYFSDKVGIESKLIRSNNGIENLYNVVKCGAANDEHVVDLMQPFRLFPLNSENASTYIRGEVVLNLPPSGHHRHASSPSSSFLLVNPTTAAHSALITSTSSISHSLPTTIPSMLPPSFSSSISPAASPRITSPIAANALTSPGLLQQLQQAQQQQQQLLHHVSMQPPSSLLSTSSSNLTANLPTIATTTSTTTTSTTSSPSSLSNSSNNVNNNATCTYPPASKNRWIAPVNFETADVRKFESLGRGRFASVHRCEVAHFTMAVKVFDLKSTTRKDQRNFVHEVALLRRLKHENIIAYIGEELQVDNLFLFMEYIPHCLRDVLDQIESRNRNPFTQPDVLFTALSLGKALQYIHQLPEVIVHGDIKAKNMLVELNASGSIIVAKLCDFGSCTPVSQIAKRGNIIGTVRFMAPEVLSSNGSHYDQKADVWSFGLVIWELMTAKLPYNEFNLEEVRPAIGSGVLPRTQIDITSLYPLASNVFSWSLKTLPSQRPAMSDIVQHLKNLKG